MIWVHFIDFDEIMGIEWESILIYVFLCQMQSGVGPEPEILYFSRDRGSPGWMKTFIFVIEN